MSYNLSHNYEEMYHGAVGAGLRYLLQNKSIKTLIIGVSGGIDSALVCALAKAACDRSTERKVSLIGKSISIESNTEGEVYRAKNIGRLFCDGFEHIDLTEQYKQLLGGINAKLPEVMDHEWKVRAGNVKARLRMIYLYNLASEYDGLVLGTDNLTEYMLGFWTLHGDVGDFGLIQNLWKTEVYGLSEWLEKNILNIVEAAVIRKAIDAVPTDGLGITDSDLDQLLPARSKPIPHIDGYRQIDNTLINWLTAGLPHPPPKPFIKHNSAITRYLQTEFKRNNPTSVARNLLVI